jgi:hypothetical protein
MVRQRPYRRQSGRPQRLSVRRGKWRDIVPRHHRVFVFPRVACRILVVRRSRRDWSNLAHGDSGARRQSGGRSGLFHAGRAILPSHVLRQHDVRTCRGRRGALPRWRRPARVSWCGRFCLGRTLEFGPAASSRSPRGENHKPAQRKSAVSWYSRHAPLRQSHFRHLWAGICATMQHHPPRGERKSRRLGK